MAMIKENTILDFLRNIELFRNLDEVELAQLSRSVTEKYCEAGEILFKENSPREDIFIIYDGEIELFKRDSYGVEVRLAIFGRGISSVREFSTGDRCIQHLREQSGRPSFWM